MRVNLHDFSGHPFQAQLSRDLAARGHHVLHEYSSQYVTGHGRLSVDSGRPAHAAHRVADRHGADGQVPPAASHPFRAGVRRRVAPDARARGLRRRRGLQRPAVRPGPDAPVSSPSGSQPWVLWHQDVYSLGVAAEATRRLPRPAAAAVRRQVERIERAQVASAASVVAIGEPFVDAVRPLGCGGATTST